MGSRLLRLLGHRVREVRTFGHSLSPAVLDRLTKQVAASECQHSGEIRIVVERGLPLSGLLWQTGSLRQLIRERALAVFSETRVWDTAQNNGVLVYLLLAERAIEIVADRGLNEKVSPEQWQTMIHQMGAAFAAGQFDVGLELALKQVSALLVLHFAVASGASNANELPDQPLVR